MRDSAEADGVTGPAAVVLVMPADAEAEDAADLCGNGLLSGNAQLERSKLPQSQLLKD